MVAGVGRYRVAFTTPADVMIAPGRDMLIGLYGAGTMGRAIGRAVDFPFTFVDDTPSKIGTVIDGHDVASFAEFSRSPEVTRRLYICIYQPGFSYLRKRDQLRQACPAVDVRPFTEIFRSPAADRLLPYLFFEKAEELRSKLPRYEEVRGLLEDELSRRTLDGHIRFRQTGRFEEIVSTPRQDVPFLREVLSPDVTYVDGGAFDGDTAEDFLELASGRFGRIHLVEPDARNLERAKLRFQGRIDPDQIAYHPTAIGTRHGLVGFNALGSVGSAVDEAVDEKVRTVPLSAFGSDSQMYIKLDIEGLEIDAIAAELDFLSSCRPLLGISVYHRPDDLLDAVKLIQTASPEYRLYLRCHGEAGEDLLLYAIS